MLRSAERKERVIYPKAARPIALAKAAIYGSAAGVV